MARKSDQNGRSILFITYYFPPIHSIGAVRSKNLVEQFEHMGYDCWVITTTNRALFRKDDYGHLARSAVYPAFTLDYRTLLTLRRSTRVHLSEEKKRGPFKLLVKINLSFPFNLLWGEGGLVYIIGAFFKACYWVRKHRIKIVYSSFMPYADHVAAFLLKLVCPKIYWVADFRDLHVDPVRKQVIWGPIQKWFNRVVLAKANLVTTVSQGLATHLSAFKTPLYILPNGIDPALLDDPQRLEKTEKFTITYTGSIYDKLQDPSPLLQSLVRLLESGKMAKQNLRIVYAGKDSSIWRSWLCTSDLEACFEDQGLVSHRESLQLQRSSNVNILLSWTSKDLQGILTGKLYEYLAAGCPILAVLTGDGRDKELEEIFLTLNAGYILYAHFPEHNQVDDLLLELYLAWLNDGKIQRTIDSEKLKTFRWDYLARIFERELKPAISDE